jgi:hypothetical protein
MQIAVYSIRRSATALPWGETESYLESHPGGPSAFKRGALGDGIGDGPSPEAGQGTWNEELYYLTIHRRKRDCAGR